MIIYSTRKLRRQAAPWMDQLLQQARNLKSSDVEAATTLLIEAGELESALLDGGACDDYAIRALDELTRAAARAVITGHPSAREVLAQAACVVLPDTLDTSPIEGFAYYCLFPSCYAEAAKAFWKAERPSRALVIGIRTAGGPLSAIVAAQLEECGVATVRTTVRPDGHPFDRQVRFDDSQQETVASADWIAVVDEGPGISGSSFGATVRAVLAEGVDLSRIAIFPSWDADAESLRSAYARRLWPSLNRYVVPFCPQRDAPALAEIQAEWSAGNWRGALLETENWPASHPQHERRKYLCRDDGGFQVAHFAGLGGYGEEILKIAELLSERWTQREPALHDGFVVAPFVEGRSLTIGHCTEDFLDHATRYIAERARLPVQPYSSTSFEEMEEMIVTNCTEAGLSPPKLAPYRHAFGEQQLVAVDGRMQPHEWIRTPDGFRKLDAVDHHRDHFFPGCTDPAWDLAGLCTEFLLNDAVSRSVAERYIAASRDFTILHRLPLYRIGYLAFRVGYCDMASHSLGGDEASRFHMLKARYRNALQQVVQEGA